MNSEIEITKYVHDLYRRALECIIKWPDNYEEIAFPETVAFANVMLNINTPVNITIRAIELAEHAIANKLKLSQEFYEIITEWGMYE